MNANLIAERLNRIEVNQRLMIHFLGKLVANEKLVDEDSIFKFENNIEFPPEFLSKHIRNEEIHKVSKILEECTLELLQNCNLDYPQYL